MASITASKLVLVATG